MTYKKEDFYEVIRDYHLSWDFQDLLEDILERIEDATNDEDIFQAIDDSLIYYKDQWTVLKEFCNPTSANWEYAIEELIHMVFSVSAQLMKE